MLATLSETDLQRVARFGEKRSYADGELISRRAGRFRGWSVVLSGQASFSLHDPLGQSVSDLGEQGPGYFLGDVGQLSGARSIVDRRAVGPVEVLVLPPDRLRALLLAEVELGERILRALMLRRVGAQALGLGGPVLVGSASHARLRRLQEFLLRSGYPHRLLDPETSTEALALANRHASRPEDLPLAICPDGSVLKNPGDIALSRYLDVLPNSVQARGYDVAVVGAGPAGLSTAVYGASEGLSVLVIDARGFGGQASASARIENYFGFAAGITGQDLAGQGFTQALKFGTEFAIPATATRLSCEVREGPGSPLSIQLDDGRTVSTRTVVIASGARYRRPAIPTLAPLEGRGVSYWASPIEVAACRGQDVVLLGGGNSAGQAAVYLSGHAARVLMLIRGSSLSETMSRYLADRIASASNILLHPFTELTDLVEDERGELATVRWKDRRTGAEETATVQHLFVFVGADPVTEWLQGCGVALDAKGFVKTGADLTLQDLVGAGRRDVPRSSRDQRARRLRRGRRAVRIGEARGRRDRRGSRRRSAAPCLPGRTGRAEARGRDPDGSTVAGLPAMARARRSCATA